jgi:hypothetical protein
MRLASPTPASTICTPMTVALPAAAATHPQVSSRSVGDGGVGKTTRPTKAAPSSTIKPPYSSQRPATLTGETGAEPNVWVTWVELGGVAPTPKAKEPRARCPSTEETVVHATV